MHKYFFRLLFCALSGCLTTVDVHGQQPVSNVEKAAKVLYLRLDSIASGKKPGIYQITRKGEKLAVRVNNSGKIDHIGCFLFNATIRALQPSPIYDYLEFVVLDHKYHISENSLQQQQLKFKVGDWTVLEHVTDSTQCQVSNVEDKYYEVTWKKDAQVIASVNFPINYELLANSNRKTILENFVSTLRQYTTVSRPTQKIDTAAIKPYNKEGIYVLPGDSYTIPSINTNIYFRQKEGKAGGYERLHDNQYPAETLANRLLLSGSFSGNATMKVTCYLYNHRKEIVLTTVTNWMAFCQENGCKPYYGFEGDRQGMLTATLIMRNRESGYDHVLTVTCQREQLEADDMQIDAVAYLYTPSSNVGNLFHESSESSKNQKYILK